MRKYQIIYADPPWHYRQRFGSGIAEDHYPTMTIDELKALPVRRLADKDCALFLWITCPMLSEAWEVIETWGFTYKTVAFVWVKVNNAGDRLHMGMGWWTRSNVELCLLATRGHPKRQNNRVYQVIISNREAHSKKPDEVRRRIESLMGELPRVELFARQYPPGWDVWGNEVICSFKMEDYNGN